MREARKHLFISYDNGARAKHASETAFPLNSYDFADTTDGVGDIRVSR